MAHREAEALAILDEHTVGAGLEAGFRQERLGAAGIVGVRLDARIEGPAARRELAGRDGGVALEHLADDAGHVDRVIERAPNADVREGRQVLAPAEIRVRGVVGDEHLEVGGLLETRHLR